MGNRHAWKKASEYIEHNQSMFIDYGQPQELNTDGEFNIPNFNQFLSRNNVTVRYKEGCQNLATIDAYMHNFKKTIKPDARQGHGCVETLLPTVTRAHNRLAHEALMGNDPNEAYEGENKALQFELREEAGNKMAQQNAVVVHTQTNKQ